MKKLLFGLLAGGLVVLIGRPLIGLLLEAGTKNGTFSLNASELADAKNFVPYLLAAIVFYSVVRRRKPKSTTGTDNLTQTNDEQLDK